MTPEERERYARQLPLWGDTGQRLLWRSRVLVLGAGGLGSVVVPYLAAAGVGTIGVVDDDTVELSNLHRQVMHSMELLGEPKTASAAVAAARLNPAVRVVRHPERLDAGNVRRLLAGYDLVVDGLDTFAARLAVSDAATELGMPHVWGSALGFDGQVSVFAGAVTLRTLFPETPEDADTDSCSVAGVLGPVCAAVGGVMAAETLKLLTGVGEPLVGRVLVYDGLDATWRELPLRAGRPAPAPAPKAERRGARLLKEERPPLRALSAAELAALLEAGEVAQLLDLREPEEIALEPAIPGALSLPFSAVQAGARPNPDHRDEQVVVYCAHGVRSAVVGRILQDEGWQIAHLDGGIASWQGR